MKLNIAAAAAAIAIAGACTASASLSIVNGCDSAASTSPYFELTDAVNNPKGDWTAFLGDNTSAQAVRSACGASGFSWRRGAQNFTFTWNPNAADQEALAVGRHAPLTHATTFNNPINYVQLSLFANNGTSDSFSVTGLTVTSLHGRATYLAPSTLSIVGGEGSQNSMILDVSGLLAGGFRLSGTLNLNNPSGHCRADENDKFVVSLGNAAVPEPTTMIAGALLLLPLGASTLRLLRKNRAPKS
jgi:hypothetical protein